jgi:hypothetical protein
MAGELEQLRRRPERWRFALGCLVATLLLPPRRAGAGRMATVLVVAAVTGSAGPVGYGLVRYPAGAAATRRGRAGATGRQTALLSAIVTGMLVFLALAGDALPTAAGPYDAGQLRDFPGSRFPDIATYAVSDNLGTAMSLLLLASVVTAALGCATATATATARFRRVDPAPATGSQGQVFP